MVSLASFALIQSAIYVIMGVKTAYSNLPPLSNEKSAPYSNLGARGPIFPVIKPDFRFSAFEVGGNPEIKPFPFVKNNVEEYLPTLSPALPQLSQLPSTELIMYNDRKLLKHYFAYNFLRKVKASKKLTEAYQVNSFSAKSLSSLFFDIVFTSDSSVFSLDPQTSAQVVSKAVAVNFDKLKKHSLLGVFTHSVSHYLFFRGYLNLSNVERFSEQYFEFVKRNVNSVEHPTPEANIKAVGGAFVEFLKSLKLYNAHSTFMIAEVFSYQIYKL